MINYFNFKKFDVDYLITNDMGRYSFVDRDILISMIKNNVDINNSKYSELKENMFVFDEHPSVFTHNVSDYVSANKRYLLESTGLFIFVVTKRCNMNCIYCQAKANQDYDADMTKEIAKKGVDIALSSPGQHITIEFQGGEPLLNYDIVKYIIDYSQAIKGDKTIEYCIATNLSLLNDEILEYFKKYFVGISTSLDGDKKIHTYNRQCNDKTFDDFERKVYNVKKCGCSLNAIQTTTRYSLKYPKDIINEYVRLGFDSIFIRPLTKLGSAKELWDNIGYTSKEFLKFYEICFKYIIELNKSGTYIQETHASILLRKILAGYSDNYMELRSPCGAGVGQMAINYDGNIYTCDEGRMLAEMGNQAFLLGNVYNSTYNELVESPVCKTACASSVLESQLKCCDCVYQPYCGVCPVINLANENDIVSKSPKQYRCEIYEGILDLIFNILKSDDLEAIEILKNWADVRG